MKKIVLLSLAVALSVYISAQNVDKEKVSFNYLRNPLEKLDSSLKTYKIEVEVSWSEKEKQKESDYQAELAKADEEYNAALENYNSKSFGSKLAEKALLGDTKPVKRLVEKPSFIPQPDIPSIVSSISLDGYGQGNDDAVLIKVVYHDIYVGDPIDKETVKDEVGYRVRSAIIKQPVEYSLITPDGKVVYNEVIKSSGEDFIIKSKEIKTGDEWNKYIRDEWDGYLRSQLMGYYKRVSLDINNSLNNKFGYSKVERTTTLFMGSGKNYAYDTHLLALRKAQRAYEVLFTDRDEAVAKLKEAVEIWEKELEESNPADKKSRINGELSQALIINIAEAETLIGDYESAIDHCDKIDLMADAKRKYTREVEDLREFIKDEKQRNIKE
jgi:hypothetical protein